MIRDPLAAVRRAEKVCLESGKADRSPCWICGRPIQYGRNVVVHRITDPANGGDPADLTNLVPVHRECAPPRNSRRW